MVEAGWEWIANRLPLWNIKYFMNTLLVVGLFRNFILHSYILWGTERENPVCFPSISITHNWVRDTTLQWSFSRQQCVRLLYQHSDSLQNAMEKHQKLVWSTGSYTLGVVHQVTIIRSLCTLTWQFCFIRSFFIFSFCFAENSSV